MTSAEHDAAIYEFADLTDEMRERRLQILETVFDLRPLIARALRGEPTDWNEALREIYRCLYGSDADA